MKSYALVKLFSYIMNRKAMAARKNATAAGTRAPGTSAPATEALQKQENDNIKKTFKVGLRCFRI